MRSRMLFVLLTVGLAVGCAGGGDGSGYTPTTPTGPVTPVTPTEVMVKVTVSLPDATDVPQGMKVVASWSGGSFERLVPSNGGTVEVPVPSSGTCPTVKVSGDSRYLDREVVGSCAREHRLVVNPKRWTVKSGMYAGQTIDIPYADLFRPAAPEMNDNGSFFQLTPSGVLIGWDASVINWAFDRTASTLTVSAVDSAKFKVALDNLGRRLNRTFVPTTLNVGSSVPVGTMSVVFGTSSQSSSGVYRSDGNGNIVGGTLTLTSNVLAHDDFEFYVHHETMHVIGVWHAPINAFVTVMCPSAPGVSACKSASGKVATVMDAGLIEFRDALRRLARSGAAFALLQQ
jgi:hypothetical protein